MTQAVNCPGCKQQIAIDDSPLVNQVNQLQTRLQQLEKEPKMPSIIPSYQCKDGTCGQNHLNPRYTKLPKGKCRNCDQFSASKEGKCSWCDQDEIEEIDKEELEDLGIKMPGF